MQTTASPSGAASILVIDDDATLRQLIVLTLARKGYLVHAAENGRIGLRLFDTVKPDLVITDILMPETEGMATIMALREKARRPKIIAISGGGRLLNRDVLKWATHLGADEVLPKPFRMSSLAQAVGDLLREDADLKPAGLPAWLGPVPLHAGAA